MTLCKVHECDNMGSPYYVIILLVNLWPPFEAHLHVETSQHPDILFVETLLQRLPCEQNQTNMKSSQVQT